jgi:hypothetical protein
MSKITPEELLDGAYRVAEGVLVGKKGGEMLPTFIMITSKGPTVITTPWADEDDKSLLIRLVKLKMKEDGAIAYSFVSEVWIANQPEGWKIGDPVGTMPVDRPDRREGVVACAGLKGQKALMKTWLVERGPDGRVVRLIPEKDGRHETAGGRLTEMLM